LPSDEHRHRRARDLYEAVSRILPDGKAAGTAWRRPGGPGRAGRRLARCPGGSHKWTFPCTCTFTTSSQPN